MRQLIARIDDRLHGRLKSRAAAEGRSVNALVTELLARGLSQGDGPATVRARAQLAGLQVIPRPARRPPSRDAAIAATRGAGDTAGIALASDRARR